MPKISLKVNKGELVQMVFALELVLETQFPYDGIETARALLEKLRPVLAQYDKS